MFRTRKDSQWFFVDSSNLELNIHSTISFLMVSNDLTFNEQFLAVLCLEQNTTDTIDPYVTYRRNIVSL